MEDSSGVIYLKNRENIPSAGIKIQFTNLGDSWYGPYIRSSLDNANGPSSRMALKLGSYWDGEKNELTLLNGNVGIGTSNPNSSLDIRGNFRVESNGNVFAYSGGADLILKAPARGDNGNGRALVHDDGNILTINYGGDFSGGTKIGTTLFKNDGNAAFQGKIEAKEIKVTQSPTADFVFEESYKLPNLEDVEKYIKRKKTLARDCFCQTNGERRC